MITVEHIAAAESAMHELLHVDASMADRVAVAEKLAHVFGLPWPPYPDAVEVAWDEGEVEAELAAAEAEAGAALAKCDADLFAESKESP